MQNGNDLEGRSFRAVNNQVGVDREKPHIGGGQVLPLVPSAWKFRKVEEFAANDRLYMVGGFSTSLDLM